MNIFLAKTEENFTHMRIFLGFLKELNQEGKTLLVVTHDPYVAGFCDRKIELSSYNLIKS